MGTELAVGDTAFSPPFFCLRCKAPLPPAGEEPRRVTVEEGTPKADLRSGAHSQAERAASLPVLPADWTFLVPNFREPAERPPRLWPLLFPPGVYWLRSGRGRSRRGFLQG